MYYCVHAISLSSHFPNLTICLFFLLLSFPYFFSTPFFFISYLTIILIFSSISSQHRIISLTYDLAFPRFVFSRSFSFSLPKFRSNLPFYLSIHICLSFFPTIYLSIHLTNPPSPICLSIYLSILSSCFSTNLTTYPTVYVNIHLYLSIYLFIPFIHLSSCEAIYLSIYLSDNLLASLYLFILLFEPNYFNLFNLYRTFFPFLYHSIYFFSVLFSLCII